LTTCRLVLAEWLDRLMTKEHGLASEARNVPSAVQPSRAEYSRRVNASVHEAKPERICKGFDGWRTRKASGRLEGFVRYLGGFET